MRLRCHVTPSSISTETQLAFSQSMSLGKCWELAKNPGSNCQENKPAICRGRSGCKFTMPRRDGPRRKRPMFRLARDTRLFRHFNWRWPTRQSQMAASAITHVWSTKVGGKTALRFWMSEAIRQRHRRVCDRIYVRKSHLTKLTLCAKAVGKSIMKMAAAVAERA